MAKIPENSGKKWANDDISKLKDMASKNRVTGIIAYELKRTEDAIRSKANELNISLQPTNKSPYDRKVSDAKKDKK